MPGFSGLLAMTMMVRDEEEILAVNLDHHFALGVDLVFVLDHGSTDATADILDEYVAAGRVRRFRDNKPGFGQSARISWLLEQAADAGADWVLHGDADEFWVPAAGNLRDVFAAVPDRYGYLSVPRHDFPPVPDESGPFYQRLVARPPRSFNDGGFPLAPKVAQRPAAGRTVAAGNHALVDALMPPAPDIGAVEILHFPMRTYARFEHKVMRNGEAHEHDEFDDPGFGGVARERLATFRRGELPAYWRQRLLDPEQVDSKVAAGELVIDRRLPDLLAAGGAEVRESPQVRALLSTVWARQAELESLRGQLETVRNSRIMRSTRRLRRAYYGLRSRGQGA